MSGSRSINQALPKIVEDTADDNLYLCCFDDIYGFRAKNEGKGRHIFYLKPWEFVMYWQCLPLPPPPSPLSRETGEGHEPDPAAETDNIIFFPEGIPGAVDFRRRYYLRRRHRPMVPAPSGTPMPDQAKYVRKRYLLYSLYMRLWTLCPEWSEDHVPYPWATWTWFHDDSCRPTCLLSSKQQASQWTASKATFATTNIAGGATSEVTSCPSMQSSS